MARYNYFGRGDEYSEWHRNIQDDSLGYIDLDVVEFHKFLVLHYVYTLFFYCKVINIIYIPLY